MLRHFRCRRNRLTAAEDDTKKKKTEENLGSMDLGALLDNNGTNNINFVQMPLGIKFETTSLNDPKMTLKTRQSVSWEEARRHPVVGHQGT